MNTHTKTILLAVASFVAVFFITKVIKKAAVSPTVAATAPATAPAAPAAPAVSNPSTSNPSSSSAPAAGNDEAAAGNDEAGNNDAGNNDAGAPTFDDEAYPKTSKGLISITAVTVQLTDDQLLAIDAFNVTRTRLLKSRAKYNKAKKSCFLTSLRKKVIRMIAKEDNPYGIWVSGRVSLENYECISLVFTLEDDQDDAMMDLFLPQLNKMLKGRHVATLDGNARTITVVLATRDEWAEIRWSMAHSAEVAKMTRKQNLSRLKALRALKASRKAIEKAQNLTYAQARAKAKAKAKVKARAKAKAERKKLAERVRTNKAMINMLKTRVRTLTTVKRHGGGQLEVIDLDK